MRKSNGQVVTFYSFKGGVGRSFALANVGVLLAQWGYKVLCVDWDLEAPGLHHYFHKWMSKTRTRGLMTLIEAVNQGKKKRWQTQASRVHLKAAGGRLDLLPAGQTASTYVQRVQSLDWSSLYEKRGFGAYLESVRAEWKKRYDFVLIDSRTGISDVSGICTVQLPDVLVFLFTANRQSMDGACDIAERAVASRSQLPFERSRLLTLPVVSRYEQRVEFKIASRWDKEFERRLRGFYSGWLPKRASLPSIIASTRLPHVPFWTFGEGLPIVSDLSRNDDPESINYSLINIAGLLANRFENANELLTGREAFLARARRLAGRETFSPNSQNPIFICHSSGSSRFAASLAVHLQKRGFATRLTKDFPTAVSREALLDTLKRATSFLIIIDRELSPWQYDELTTYVSLNVKEDGPNQIISIVRSRVALNNMPRILRGLPLIVSRNVTVDSVVEHVLRRLTSNGRGSSGSATTRAQLWARFDLRNGRPMKEDDEYVMSLGIQNAPTHTDRVRYEVHDETFEVRRWTVLAKTPNFQDTILAYGDAPLTAEGVGRTGVWRISSTLVEALRNGYKGMRTSAAVRRAIADIAAN